VSTFTNPISASAGYRPVGETQDLVQRPLKRLARALDHVAEHRRLRRASAQLAMVDERTLRDIGLTRCELDRGRRATTRFEPYC